MTLNKIARVASRTFIRLYTRALDGQSAPDVRDVMIRDRRRPDHRYVDTVFPASVESVQIRLDYCTRNSIPVGDRREGDGHGLLS